MAGDGHVLHEWIILSTTPACQENDLINDFYLSYHENASKYYSLTFCIFDHKLKHIVSNTEPNTLAENRALLWCQLCRHWRHRRLS